MRTVYAKGDIDVHVTEGVIKVQGKTETATGNITMYAHNEKDAQNIVINQDGKLISGQDLTLHAYNGDIQVTDNTTAQRDLTVIIDNKGSVDFKKDVDVTGKVSATTKEGDIRIGETIDAGKEIVMTTGSGNIAVGEDVTSGRSVTLTSGAGYIDIGAKVTAKTDSVVVKTGSGDITVGEDVTAGTTVDLTTGTGHITVGNGSAGNVKGGGDVTVATGAGDVTINKTVASTDGSIDITSGKGKIHIGNNGNGPTDLTVHAKQNIALTAQDGVIEVFGKTKTDVGDITVLARDKDNTKNLLIDFNGELDAASTSDDPKATGNLKLQTYNGDIEISDRTKAKGDIYAKVENKGDISFGRDVDTQGSLTFEVDDGNVKVGKDLTAAKDITITSGKGDVVVGDTKTGDGGNVLSKTGDVSIQTGQGDVKIVKTVTAQEGSIDIATQEGNIHIGDNGPDVKTVTAKENVSLVTENGTIEVFGKTSTQNGDITLKAANPTYTAGPDGQNIIIDHNGQIASGQDATLIAKNGDLHVTDRVTAQRDVNAITRSKGDVFLDNDLKVNGSVTMQTDTGNINADRNVAAVNRIVAATGNGDITVGTANARYVALTSGGEDGNVQANAVHAQASGNANGTGAEDVKLGGSHVTVGTIVNDSNNNTPLTISTLGGYEDKPMKDINIGVRVADGVYTGGIQSASGAVVQDLWTERGLLYMKGDTNLHVSKVVVKEKLHVANDIISVGVFGVPPYHDGARMIYWNDAEAKNPSSRLARWYDRSYSDPEWMYLDLFGNGDVGSRYGVLMDAHWYRNIYGDSVSMVDTMRIRTEPIPMGDKITYFDRNNLIEIDDSGLYSDADPDEITAE